MEYNEVAAKMRKTLKGSPICAHLVPYRGNSFGSKCSPNHRCISKRFTRKFFQAHFPNISPERAKVSVGAPNSRFIKTSRSPRSFSFQMPYF